AFSTALDATSHRARARVSVELLLCQLIRGRAIRGDADTGDAVRRRLGRDSDGTAGCAAYLAFEGTGARDRAVRLLCIRVVRRVLPLALRYRAVRSRTERLVLVHRVLRRVEGGPGVTAGGAADRILRARLNACAGLCGAAHRVLRARLNACAGLRGAAH